MSKWVCYLILDDVEIFDSYQRSLGINNNRQVLEALAQAIAASFSHSENIGSCLVVRLEPSPVLALISCIQEKHSWIGAQVRSVRHACTHLTYISYVEAERACEQLAAELLTRFGRTQLEDSHFVAIPRGGTIILGMLSYLIPLKHQQLSFPPKRDKLLVIVDDCAFSGHRFAKYLKQVESERIVFAHLYSHPQLRAAIEAQESAVIACISARDLHTPTENDLKQDWRAWLRDERYWFGDTEHLCFAWSEPDRLIGFPEKDEIVAAWRIVPPAYCLKNRPRDGENNIAIQIQPAGQGSLRPTKHVVFGDLGNQIIIGDLESGRTVGLEGVAADIWRLVVRYGTIEIIVKEMCMIYEVPKDQLREDVEQFLNQLLSQELLEQR